MAVIADDDIAFDNGIRTDMNIFTELRFRIDDGSRMNLNRHYFGCLLIDYCCHEFSFGNKLSVNKCFSGKLERIFLCCE